MLLPQLQLGAVSHAQRRRYDQPTALPLAPKALVGQVLKPPYARSDNSCTCKPQTDPSCSCRHIYPVRDTKPRPSILSHNVRSVLHFQSLLVPDIVQVTVRVRVGPPALNPSCIMTTYWAK